MMHHVLMHIKTWDEGCHHVLMSIKSRSRREDPSCVDGGQVKSASCVDAYSSQEPGLEVNMCVIKLQESMQGKGMTN